MHAAQIIIDREGFSPHTTAMLHEVFGEVWSSSPNKSDFAARSIAASLCALARSGQHSRARFVGHGVVMAHRLKAGDPP